MFVVGPHRSGTSAITGLINALGVPLCQDADLVPAGEGNVAGHWESATLTRRNEQILHLLGAAWDCPPAADRELAQRLTADLRTGPARRAFHRAYPTDRWVWKDPRLCVVLPFWRAALSGHQVAVLVVRHPLEVARSLAARNELTIGHGLAIWERYLRGALLGCAGLPVLVVKQADLISDPARTTRELRRFLAHHGFEPTRAVSGAAAGIDLTLHHHVVGGRVRGLSPQQRRLWHALESQVGEHPAFAPPSVGPETPGLDALLAPRRSFWGWPAPAGLVVDPALGRVAPYC